MNLSRLWRTLGRRRISNATTDAMIEWLNAVQTTLTRNHEELMSKLDDTQASIATLSASIDSLIAAKADPAVAAQLAADEAGLDAIKASVDDLVNKINTALAPPTPPA